MARGNEIIVSANPRGRFIEGKLATGITPKPGTILQLQVATAIDTNGRFTFELFNADADGARPKGPLCILDMDWGAGKDCFGRLCGFSRCSMLRSCSRRGIQSSRGQHFRYC